MKEPPIPMDELIRWCEANRPDVVGMLREIDQNERIHRDAHRPAQAAVFLVSLAFQAGRAFQAAPQHADVYLPQRTDPYAEVES